MKNIDLIETKEAITALHLLDNITIIRNKYDEIAKVTGENFNIFSVLHLESDEVRLHSRLLGELLNPKGTHNQNELFLKLFVANIGLETKYSTEQLKNATVYIEKNIGLIPDDYSVGGRIDLVIKFPNNDEIVIENKIWAGDQFNQLGRYYEEYPKSHIVYLTPFGNKPSIGSLGKLPLDNVICISYQLEILNWLELCQKEVYKQPLIREIFSHYINVINKLTNKTNFHQMNDDISKLIIKDITYFKSANDLVNSFNTINQKICSDAQVILKDKFFKKYGEQFRIGSDEGFESNILFFTYNEYFFKLRLAEEFGISIWLTPGKENNKFGVANDEGIVHFKKYFKTLKNNYSSYNENQNYTAWIVSENDFLHWDIEKRFELTKPEFVEDITNKILQEIEFFVNTFKEETIKDGLNLAFNF